MKHPIKTRVTANLFLLSSLILLQACHSEQATQTVSNQTTSAAVSTTTSLTESTSPETTVSDATTQTGLDFKAIESGDYASLVGTWQNDLGDTYTFDENGLVSTEYSLTGAFLRDDGFLEMMITSADQTEQIGLVFAKTGQTFSSDFFADGSEDNSDANRDRFAITSTQFDSNQGFDSRVLYKVQ
ncbi:DUF6287 domain-containing protein [Streptococcus caprae]|uniref:DUF6287 domain-containing protein n=1 Tax=Streptococcus caprae TaxID=1640501 RepID=A0ABV8CX85_9STRE